MSGKGEELSETAPGHYRQEYIRCGKARCRKCNPPEGTSATGHGPYWYRYVWLGGKQRKRYVGKELPAHVQTRLELVPGSASAATTATVADSTADEPTETLPKTPETGPVLGVVSELKPQHAAANESSDTTPKTPTPKTGATKRHFDLDTVRFERGELDRWRVVAGSEADPVLVGYVEPVRGMTGRKNGWRPLDQDFHPIQAGRSWKTRREALLCLVEPYVKS